MMTKTLGYLVEDEATFYNWYRRS